MHANLDWNADDIATAAQQGWRLVYVWDEKFQRLEYQMRTVKNDLRIDLVSTGASPNKLAARAIRLIFDSKVGSLRPTKRKQHG